MFGTPGVALNITFADGENGWAYKDGNNGTYLYFKHLSVGSNEDADDEEEQPDETESDENAATGSAADESSADVGTATGSGTVVLAGLVSGVVGIFIGFIVPTVLRKKKNKE